MPRLVPTWTSTVPAPTLVISALVFPVDTCACAMFARVVLLEK
jgi:hypothetical protein